MTQGEAPAPVVVIFLQTDFTRGESGYTSRCRDQVRFFSSRMRTIVYSFYEDDIRPWDAAAIARFRADFPGVELALDHRTKPLNALQRLKNLLIARRPQDAGRIARLRLPGTTPAFDRIAAAHPDALFFVNLSEGLTALNGVAFRRLVIDTHDVRFLKQATVANVPVHHGSVIATLRHETALLALAETIIAIAPLEQAVFASLLPETRVLFIPDFADRSVASPRRTGGAYAYDLLFVGSEYAFNVEGLCAFLQRHRAWLADYRIAIAGRVCQAGPVIAAARDIPSAELLGFVDDLDALYNGSKVAISPVRGTGLKIKILEALAAGVPVFGSAESLEGLPPGSGNCVFLEDQAKMTRFLADPAALTAASEAALRYSQALADMPDRQVLLDLIHRR